MPRFGMHESTGKRNHPSRTANGALGALTVTLVCLCSSPALAHGEEALLILLGIGFAWHALVGAVMMVPTWMRGRRAVALAIYVVAVIIAWMINFAIPVDSYADFWPILGLPLLVATGLLALGRLPKGSA